jgi:predicted SAM-dependent methyltransferase
MLSFRKALLTIASHRTLSLIRWDLHFLRVRIGNTLSGADRKLRSRIARMPRPRYLNLGSGERGFDSPNWINVDGFPFLHTHYLADISRPLPFEDASFDGVFFQHVLEHFSRETGLSILRECRRILIDGGVLRVAVPDAERVIRTYVKDPSELLKHRTAKTGLPMDVVNMYAYQRYEHQCLYDFALLHRTLCDAGFGEVERRDIGEGVAKDLIVDDPVYAWESLYAEARARNADLQPNRPSE